MTRNQRLLAGLGIGALVVYLTTATGVVHDNRITVALAFAIGPVAVIAILRLVASLAPDIDPPTQRLCRIFLATAFVLFTTMVVIQQMLQLQFRDLAAAAPDAATVATLGLVRQGVNTVQRGLDVAFDLFYCVGIVVLAGALYRHPAFGRFVGALGIASGGALLALNLIAFPYVPAESGLVDLGPVTGLWWLMIIGLQWRRRRSQAQALAAA